MVHTIHKIKFIASGSSGEVSGIFVLPAKPKFFLIFAHGAGAGMNHFFMQKMSDCLANKDIATLRYNFPYSEKKINRPDPAPILMETVRSAVKPQQNMQVLCLCWPEVNQWEEE